MSYSHIAVNKIEAGFDECFKRGMGKAPEINVKVQCDKRNNGDEFELDMNHCRGKAHQLLVDELLYKVIRERSGMISYIFQKVG